jgi:hypothetical protein
MFTKDGSRSFRDGRAGLAALAFALAFNTVAQEAANLYGIHDSAPSPQEYLDHINNGGAKGWVTATFAIGANPNDFSGTDLTWIANQGHTVIGRLNYGYCPDGTIPVSSQYANFAQRCANFVNASPGCNIWIIGNEPNLSSEWPVANNYASYVSPQSYADCFRQCYNAIKTVKPNAKVISAPLAPWAGPYGAGVSGCGINADGNPLNWVTYLNQMLTAISQSGPLDGIGLHINSRGYTYNDIHSTAQVNAGGQNLYWSFYVYKDWVNLGIPSSLYNLPLYATECNGYFYWSGGHPENPAIHYEAGWTQEIYAEINRWNQTAASTGKPIFRCVNMYRWCNGCDGWNIDGSPYKGQILADLDQAVSFRYTWPGSGGSCWGLGPGNPAGTNLAKVAAYYIESGRNQTDQYGRHTLDGSTSTKWCANASLSGGTATLAVDLGRTCTLNGYIVRHASAGGEPTYFNTKRFRIESATSMFGPWTTEWDVNNDCQDQYNRFVYGTAKSLRYIRLVITNPGIDSFVRLPEFEIYGTAGANGTIEIHAPDYAGGVNAGNNTDYLDGTAGNSGGAYRTQDVDIESSTDGRYNIGWTANTEWLNYPVQGQAGTYTLNVRYATPYGGTMHFSLDGVALTGTLTLNNTGGWQTWQTLNAGNVTLGSGWKTISLRCDSANFNVHRFWLAPAGSKITITENYSSMPAWSSSFDAAWGGAATWSIVSGGQSGNCLQAARSNTGSSTKVKVYGITANSAYTISVYIRCPSSSSTYWAETAFKLGNFTAQDFDQNAGTWTMLKKFDNVSANGNGDVWTQYSATFNSGSATQISVGYKLGSSSGNGPVVKWDTLRIQ